MVVTARAEHVGSLLRPPFLLRAREELAAGTLGQAAFKRIEDRAVREVVALQEGAGCPIVTVGELRRDSFQSELTAAVDGFQGVDMDAWLWGEWHSDVVGTVSVARPPDLGVVAPMRRRRNLAAEELVFSRGWPAERWLSYGVALDNQVIDAGRPATFGFHLCRGNQHSRWLVAGGYEPVARQVLAGVHADRLLLEYDDERSGGFEPLALVPDDKLVVLGLVTTKTPGLESGEELERRLREAAALVGMERLALGTQCGFATSVGGNAISVDDQRRKLQLIVRTAERVLGDLQG